MTSQLFRPSVIVCAGRQGLGPRPRGAKLRRQRFASTIASLVVALVILLTTAPVFAANFQSLGDLPGGGFFSKAFGVSSDGSVVVGRSTRLLEFGLEAFRWTPGGGMVGLEDDPLGAVSIFGSQAFGVSADGSVVVGEGLQSGISALEVKAFRWTSGGGMVGLGLLPPKPFAPPPAIHLHTIAEQCVCRLC